MIKTKKQFRLIVSHLFFLIFSGDEPGSQEGDSIAVQVPCKILSRRRRRGIDTRHYTATFLSPSKKLFMHLSRLFLSTYDFSNNF